MLVRVQGEGYKYPRIPSTPSNPTEVVATPIDCRKAKKGPIDTVSVNSVPEKEPDP